MEFILGLLLIKDKSYSISKNIFLTSIIIINEEFNYFAFSNYIYINMFSRNY